MSSLDWGLIIGYVGLLIAMGLFHYRSNNSMEEYYVGNRKIGPTHVGLSVAATDVGGGFSIGLGGLGFTIGLSGSWLLFTGLIGAILSAFILIPVLKRSKKFENLLTYPQMLKVQYGAKAALLAGVFSMVGYLGFTASQLLAGAKIASATFPEMSMDNLLIIMTTITIFYTVLGGIKAVIFTDSVQWIILFIGLAVFGIPYTINHLGGFQEIYNSLPKEYFSLTNVSGMQILNWFLVIIPIWFIGMTLYQRIFCLENEAQAKKAWLIAGFFEWPIMAFLGTGLGLLARIAWMKGDLVSAPAAGLDAEMGLPLLLRDILPIGVKGIVLAAYFSAIMSTADSCLMATSGNVVSDIMGKWTDKLNTKKFLRLSQIVTLGLGATALLLALKVTSVLNLMLNSYAIMVAGLFIPTIHAIRGKTNSKAAISSMVAGGIVVIYFSATNLKPWGLELDPIAYGLVASFAAFAIVDKISKK